jgi:hypothetical protein
MIRQLFAAIRFITAFDEQLAAHEESFYPEFERTTRGPSSDKRLATDMFREILGLNEDRTPLSDNHVRTLAKSESEVEE